MSNGTSSVLNSEQDLASIPMAGGGLSRLAIARLKSAGVEVAPLNAARERGTETVVAPPRTPPRIEIAPSRTSTPPGELPACDSVEAALILARITNSPLSGIKYSKALGANDGKNICAATISGLANQYGGNQPATYTIEWLDRKAGRYWVQLTGRLEDYGRAVPACDSSDVVRTLAGIFQSTERYFRENSTVGFREVAFVGGKRYCLDIMYYTVEWTNEAERRFTVYQTPNWDRHDGPADWKHLWGK